MEPRTWTVVLISSNKFEAKIHADLIRDSGAGRVHVIPFSEHAAAEVDRLSANIILLTVDAAPELCLDWIRTLRRASNSRAQQAFVFLISHALTVSLAERCRRAGANAVIGLPVSSATMLNTIKKVLAKPRPFIESEAYCGPCRRAGIVTAGAGKYRRKSDSQRAA